jgi:steroid delta-isomerase-like uncharacterized protein
MKKLLLVVSLVLLLCFTFGCQNKAEKTELEKFRAQAKVEEQNKALAMQEGEMLNKGDFDALKELLAPEFLLYKPRSAKPASREEQIYWLKIFHEAFPDLSWIPQEFIAAGDKVIVRFIARGTHNGEYKGIPASGNKIEFSGIVILRMENRKIVEQREQNDISDIVMQLGMELKPKEVKK